MISEGDAAGLARRAGRRRADGSHGVRARRAWRRLVRACADGDPAAQDAVRDMTSALPEADVLDLLAAGPSEPAGQAAYLTLIGQSAQRRALDPDGALLALAYRAATPEVRERLRKVMAAEGDGDAVRIAVVGDSRDRVAEMSPAELDYLGHRFAEHRRWDELRRLALDLPVAEAVAMARMLPERERTGDSAAALAALAGKSPEELRATVGRLPREGLIMYATGECSDIGASFSPDSSELAVTYMADRRMNVEEEQVETLRIGTGETSFRYRKRVLEITEGLFTVLHLGDEILVRRERGRRGRLYRVVADGQVVRHPPARISSMARSSRGAVMASPDGLVFADRGAQRLRFQRVPRLQEKNGGRGPGLNDLHFALTTLPDAGLIALYDQGELLVLTEEGEVLHEIDLIDAGDYEGRCDPALSFLSANSLVLHRYANSFLASGAEPSGQRTEIWELPAMGAPRRTAEHEGAIRERWPLEEWRGWCLDDAFAARILISDAAAGRFGGIDEDILPWRYAPSVPGSRPGLLRGPIAVAPWGDIFVTMNRMSPDRDLRVHSPRLHYARAALERPLVRGTPRDLRDVRALRAGIGDPAVRDALDLLVACLAERFGGDIALGTGPVAAGGPYDIALGG